MTNCTITGNISKAGQSGGGIHNLYIPPVYNGGYNGYEHSAEGNGDVILTNSMISGNTSGTTPGDVEGPLAAKSANNLIGDGDNLTGISNGSQGNQIGSAQSGSVINADLQDRC